MANFNKCILIGNLTRDPETRYTPKGTCIVKLDIAINRTWKDDQGVEKEEVTFVSCNAFGRTAEVIAQYCKKGDPIMIEGRLRLETWQDKATGGNRQKLSVVVESFQFLNRATQQDGQERREQRGTAAAPSGDKAPLPAEDDDVPF